MMNENQTAPAVTENEQISQRIPFNLICVSKCKRYALEFAKSNRAQKFTRVGDSFLRRIEVAVKNAIQSEVKHHPSKGKTLLWTFSGLTIR